MAQIAIKDLTPEQVLDLLVDFAVYVSGVWEAGNEDDELAASQALDRFLAGEERD